MSSHTSQVLVARSNATLSTGTKAIFGLGLALGIILEVCICIFIAHRYRKARQARLEHVQDDVEYGTTANKAELPHEELPRTHGRSELPETPEKEKKGPLLGGGAGRMGW